MSSVGKQYRWVARHAKSMNRYNSIITVIAWRGSKALVRFPDGWVALTPGRCLRKVRKP